MASSSSDIANRSSGPSATDFWGKSDAEAKAAYHQLVSMPHLWPSQDTLKKRYGEHAIYEWTDDEYPCLIDSRTSAEFEWSRYQEDYQLFCIRWLEIESKVGASQYILYKDLLRFKALGGSSQVLTKDTLLRRHLMAEFIEAYSDILYRDEATSRFLSWLLRHNKDKNAPHQDVLKFHGIHMDKEGFVDLGLLIARDPNKRLSNILPHMWDADFWHFVVHSNNKSRFTVKFKDDSIQIAAVQGHSVVLAEPTGERALTRDNFPSKWLVHATSREAWESIRHQGLLPACRLQFKDGRKPRDRADVHFQSKPRRPYNPQWICGYATHCPVKTVLVRVGHPYHARSSNYLDGRKSFSTIGTAVPLCAKFSTSHTDHRGRNRFPRDQLPRTMLHKVMRKDHCLQANQLHLKSSSKPT